MTAHKLARRCLPFAPGGRYHAHCACGKALTGRDLGALIRRFRKHVEEASK